MGLGGGCGDDSPGNLGMIVTRNPLGAPTHGREGLYRPLFCSSSRLIHHKSKRLMLLVSQLVQPSLPTHMVKVSPVLAPEMWMIRSG